MVPRNLVVISRERLQDVLDDAVRRGRMTRDDAAQLFADLMADVEQLLGRSKDQLDRATRRGSRGNANSFPIAEYDDLTAAQVGERLDGLTPAELRKVRDYERRNANRKSVLSAVERKLS